MLRERIQPWDADKQKSSLPQRPGELSQDVEWCGHMLKHVVEHSKVEACLGWRRLEAPMPQEGDLTRGLDSVRFPAEILEPIKKLAVAAPEVQHFCPRTRLAHGGVWCQCIQQHIWTAWGLSDLWPGPPHSELEVRHFCLELAFRTGCCPSSLSRIVLLKLFRGWERIGKQ